MRIENGYYVDDRENKFSCDAFTEQEAILTNRTMKNCFRCIDCQDCIDCCDCIDKTGYHKNAPRP
jgi:hypothetical protein